MNMGVQRFKNWLRGTWLHHAVWAYRNPPPKARSQNGIPADRNAEYDRQTVEVMFRVLHRESSCIDVGANWGAILQHMISIAPRGKHYAFEPLPHLSQTLTARFPQVIVHQAAVSDVSG